MKNTRLALAATLLALAGCHHASGVGFTSRMPDGRPPFAAGAPEGYWIWQDARGWHLRATSDVPRRFHGVVESVDGSVAEVRAVGVRRGVSPGEDAIAFDWQSSGAEQGFDWAASDDCARFELYIDGDTRPLRVFLGGGEQSPARVPFAVCR
ncbi:MAG: hypothetical protein ACJ79E_17835 [Anaeromyxobacteraceae bacterium]